MTFQLDVEPKLSVAVPALSRLDEQVDGEDVVDFLRFRRESEPTIEGSFLDAVVAERHFRFELLQFFLDEMADQIVVFFKDLVAEDAFGRRFVGNGGLRLCRRCFGRCRRSGGD